MALASKHLAASRPDHARLRLEDLHSGRGAGCRSFLRLPARGRAFSLDILFYRTERGPLRNLFGEPNISHFEILSALLVDTTATFAGEMGPYSSARVLSGIAIWPAHLAGQTRRSLHKVKFLRVSWKRCTVG